MVRFPVKIIMRILLRCLNLKLSVGLLDMVEVNITCAVLSSIPPSILASAFIAFRRDESAGTGTTQVWVPFYNDGVIEPLTGILCSTTGSDYFSLVLIASDDNGAPDGVRSLVKFPALAGTKPDPRGRLRPAAECRREQLRHIAGLSMAVQQGGHCGRDLRGLLGVIHPI
jgi:hypothetical protein